MIDVFEDAAFRRYTDYLRKLIAHKSVFTDDRGITKAIAFCQEALGRNLPERANYRDELGNLVSVSRAFDRNRNAVFLCAHVDTVDADPEEWRSSSNPFAPVETDTHVIGRGANDCKAGVALMLFLSHLTDRIPLDNVVLLFSFREEGNQAKTSTAIGAALGRDIALSKTANLMLCLENTTRPGAPVTVQAYDCEPCNAFIAVTDTLDALRALLRREPAFKTVFVKPLMEDFEPAAVHTGLSGHIATIANADNVIQQAILSDQGAVIAGGDPVQTSVLHNQVRVADLDAPIRHMAILNYRGMTDIDDLKRKLAGVTYEEYFPFDFAAGSDRRPWLQGSQARKVIEAVAGNHVRLEFVANPGRSDASAIWNATTKRDNLSIYTMGPGSRSHADDGVMRKTHGPDEGFEKASGRLAVRYILNVVHQFLKDEPNAVAIHH